jgi:hypothetical protein
MKIVLSITTFLVTVLTASAQVTVFPDSPVGPIKKMNAVNNGPEKPNPNSSTTNFPSYKAAEFPYARLHDAPINWNWAHTVDISCVFPDFDADVNDPASYDFTLTDELLAHIQQAGTKIFYRLGQSIEWWSKKYGVMPPKDYKKWAQICEHIIRHYNEGWADGYHWDIQYWEIWNEPDGGFKDGRWKENKSPTWNASDKEFFKFYELVANYLNKRFPDLKIGGPALCENDEWAEDFLKYMSEKKVEMDYFSYHLYASSPQQFATKNATIKSLLDKYGYSGVEMILNEWNYLSNWDSEWQYTMEAVTTYKGAAFLSSVMSTCQDGPVDMMMYYDARPRVEYNGLFDFYTSTPLPQYYAMYAWRNLARLGTQVKSEVKDCQDIYATAAVDANGKCGVLITNFTNDKNMVEDRKVEVEIKGMGTREVMTYITDRYHLYTQVPLQFVDGKASVWFTPNSLIYIEL